jgi:hypothetical protein
MTLLKFRPSTGFVIAARLLQIAIVALMYVLARYTFADMFPPDAPDRPAAPAPRQGAPGGHR